MRRSSPPARPGEREQGRQSGQQRWRDSKQQHGVENR
jgi:hypothetical protein